jgi:hypothetical protein
MIINSYTPDSEAGQVKTVPLVLGNVVPPHMIGEKGLTYTDFVAGEKVCHGLLLLTDTGVTVVESRCRLRLIR